MDPRPYNYQFRRPRLNNPTYQSYNAYESLYHLGKKEFFNTNNILREEYSSRLNLYSPNNANPYQHQMPRQQSFHQPAPRYEDIGINTDNRNRRSSSNYSERSKSSLQSNNVNIKAERASVLSTYGSSSLEKQAINAKMANIENKSRIYNRNNTSQIYKKQQKPFDIINLYSKGNEPLRKYPKFTLEHLIYERGMDSVGVSS